jgi:membrane-bound lytic murein transglycosylase A
MKQQASPIVRSALAAMTALVGLGLGACKSAPDYERPLPDGWPALLPLEPGEPRPDFVADWPQARQHLLPALERSIEWTRKKYAEQFFPIENVSHELALASLERFRELLVESQSSREFELALAAEFDVFKSAGWNGRGDGVLYTGYCTPILPGRLEPQAGFDHPLFGLPDDLAKGPDGVILGRQTAEGISPYPTRRAIESSGMLEGRGLELAWLSDPLDAFIAHVNGSAFIELETGELIAFGYAGKNGREYTSLGRELVIDEELDADEVSLATIRQWARENPERIGDYLMRNDSFVFFTPIQGNPRGSLNVEVTSERTLATDKTLFPRGAVVFVDTDLTDQHGYPLEFRHFMMDQDTGGAIRTAGRADIYLGIGPDAERLAGRTRSEGQLYYLFLKPEQLEIRRLAP